MVRAFLLLCCVLMAVPGVAATDHIVRIGVLTSPLGTSADAGGEGSVLAAQMAVEDFGGAVLGKPVEIVVADHQNRPSVGATVARRWLEHGGADVIVDVPNASVAEAVRQTVREHHGLMIQAQAGILAHPECQSNIITWAFDGDLVTRNVLATLKERERSSWFLLSPDTRHSAETAAAIQDVMHGVGVKLVGEHKFALPAAAESNPEPTLAEILLAHNGAVIFLNAGPAATKSVALRLHRELAGRRLPQIYSQSYLALRENKNLTEIADELIYALPYRRDNAAMIALSERFAARADGRTPTMLQIGIYAAVRHYLRSVRALGTDRPGELVGAKMQELRIDDPIFGKGAILPDGRRLGDVYVTSYRTADGRDHVMGRRSYEDMARAARIAPCGKPLESPPETASPD